MKSRAKLLIAIIAGVAFFVAFALYAIDRRFKSHYANRIRHAQTVKYLVDEYYSNNHRMPSSIADLYPTVSTLLGPFNGNLELVPVSNSIIRIQERENRRSGLLHKQRIVLTVTAEDE